MTAALVHSHSLPRPHTMAHHEHDGAPPPAYNDPPPFHEPPPYNEPPAYNEPPPAYSDDAGSPEKPPHHQHDLGAGSGGSSGDPPPPAYEAPPTLEQRMFSNANYDPNKPPPVTATIFHGMGR